MTASFSFVPRTLTLRDVPEPVVRALRERARRSRRSMQKEILSILQGAVVDRAALEERLASLRSRAGTRMTPEEIRTAIDGGRP
jgi:plasmid stability protein